jgi:ferredoxin
MKILIRKKGDFKEFTVRQGLGLQAVCAKEETGIEFDCRAADCGICVKADDDERLACQVRVFGDAVIETDYL